MDVGVLATLEFLEKELVCVTKVDGLLRGSGVPGTDPPEKRELHRSLR